MQRRLGRTKCYFCDEEVEVIGPVHLITEADLKNPGRLEDFKAQQLYVAEAKCVLCGTKYTSWHMSSDKGKISDLSFRSTFDSKPGKDDLPDVSTYELAFKIAKFKSDKAYTEALKIYHMIVAYSDNR